MKHLLLLVLFFALHSMAAAQVIGDFTLTDIRNDEAVSLADYSDQKAVVVFFVSMECPYDGYYEERMRDIVMDYRDKEVQLLFVNSLPGESADALRSQVADWPGPYLDDPQQVVMRLLGATKTPEAFILIPVNGGFRKLYQGAIDNNPQVASDVKKPYLRENLNNVLAGEPLTYADVLPVGCRIRTP